MHRSITLSEIVSSTFLNNADVGEVQSKKQKFAAKFGIGVIEFLVCSLYQCYGILLAYYIQIGEYPLEKTIWTTLIYLSAWYITAPWSQFLIKFLEERRHFYYKTTITISAILLSVGITTPPHYLCYGIFGGIFSNVIFTHLKHIARRKFRTTEKAFEGNILSARAISLLIMPHIILLLVTNFPMDRVTMIYSAIILNIIPAVLIIRLPKQYLAESSFSEMNRYQTLPAFSQQIKEMKVFSTSGNTSDMNYSNRTSDLESKEDDDDESHEDSEDEENDDLLVREKNMNHHENNAEETPLPPAPLTSNTVQVYYSQAGVSILPEIPEEEEEIEEGKNINVIDPKRLSRISTALEELISKERKGSLKELVVPIEALIKPEPIQNIEYIPNYTDRKTGFIKDMKFGKKQICCSPYTLFVWKRRIRSCKDYLIDYFFIPIFRSIGDFHFYPTLFTKLSINISSVLFISLTPYVTLQKNEGYKSEDMAFLLSYTAFSWCLSLILLPLMITFSAVKLRITFIVGLVLSSCSMLLLTKRKMSNDFIIWSCLFFGFGYGLTMFAENFVYKAFAGKRRYIQFERTLNVLLGVFVILIYYFVYINNIDLVGWFPIVSFATYLVNAVIWIVIPLAKDVLIFLRKYFKKRSDSTSIL